MKTFDEIYEELQRTDNSELNNAWKEVKKKSDRANKMAITTCLIIDIFIIVMFYCKKVNFDSPFFLMHIIMFVLITNIFAFIIINGIYSGKEKNKYNEKYKKVVINKLIDNFYDNLEYFPKKGMPEYIYQEAKYEYYDTYTSDDYFEAQINNKYDIQMAEVLTQEKRTTTDSEGNTETTIITKFHGLFAKIIMHKSIKSELKIMQDKTILPNDKLKMDSSEFEKNFDVKASNPITGMQILTADVMEELVDFENKTKMKFDISIKGNELYLRFHSGNMFEPGKIKNGVLDKKLIKKYFYMLNFTYNLSNKLINVVNSIEI